MDDSQFKNGDRELNRREIPGVGRWGGPGRTESGPGQTPKVIIRRIEVKEGRGRVRRVVRSKSKDFIIKVL